MFIKITTKDNCEHLICLEFVARIKFEDGKVSFYQSDDEDFSPWMVFTATDIGTNEYQQIKKALTKSRHLHTIDCVPAVKKRG